ncbi:unnamed protein product, partial [marine sediment metagenome]
MDQRVTPLILLVILKDGKAKADVLSESDTPAQARLLVDPGLLGTEPDKKVRGDVRGDTDPDTGGRGVKINISD